MTERARQENPLEGLEAWLRGLIREEIRAVNGNGHRGDDRLLKAGEASKVLAVSRDWLYRNAHKLPFARRLPPNVVRFSYQGIQKYIATRKNA